MIKQLKQRLLDLEDSKYVRKYQFMFNEAEVFAFLKSYIKGVSIEKKNAQIIVNLIKNDMNEVPTCSREDCNKYVKFDKGDFSLTCSRTCAGKYMKDSGKSKKRYETYKENMMKNHGVENTFQLEETQNKIKATNIEKYGKEQYAQSEDHKEKTKKTVKEKYGTDLYVESKDYKKKFTESMIQNHGVTTPFDSSKIREKSVNTWINNYGVDNPLKDKSIRSKVETTNTEKYGVDNVFKSENVRDQIKQTNIERYGVDNAARKGLTPEALKAFNDPVLLQEYLDKYTVYELQEIFNCYDGPIYNRVHEYNLKIPIRTGSSYEKIISEILTENNIDHIRQDRSVIPPLEIDIYIPYVNLAIEVNGLYWHSDKFKENNYHYDKWKSCNDKGIQLLSIMEDEFIERPNTWISKILHICNQSKDRIHARKCEIKEVHKDDVKSFVEQYHLQGFVASQNYYGAYHDNELVAMMSFANTRNNKEIQMNRFCLKNGIVISGIANRLLKSFVNDHNITEVVTYSDNRYSNGGIYKQMGFEMVNTISPDYHYLKGAKRFHKSNFKKSNIESKFGIDMSNKTETDAMKELGFLRIYDCGKVKWKWSKSS
jgi:hypothetical protein